MPYIETRVTTALTKDAEKTLTEAYGKMIEVFPGKSERWLMVDFADNCRIHMAGEDGDCAMVTVALFGKGNAASFDKMTAGICRLLEEICAIPQDRIYVKYDEVNHWGWNGSNF